MIEDVWYGAGPRAAACRTALRPLAVAFGAAVCLRAWAYRRGLLGVHRACLPVVSVGALAVGGSGKTPLAMWLAAELAAAGRRPAVVCRGYGGRERGPHLLEAGSTFDPTWAERFGDEAALHAARGRYHVAVGADRVAACELAARRADVVVLDDGFQHLRLARDFDLVVVAPGDGSRSLLPAGPLRERSAALARADAAVAMDGASVPASIPRFVARASAEAVVGSAADAGGAAPSTLAGRRVVAVAAIARPERFLAALADAGASVVASHLRRDHHRYDARDWTRIAALAAGADEVVTTEKDWVKLARFALEDAAAPAPRALRVACRVEGGEALVASVLARIETARMV